MASEPVHPSLQSEMGALSLKSDLELRQLVSSSMAQDRQDRLEALAEAKKTRSLGEAEEAELAHLMEEAQGVMLRKAEVFRILARRGYPMLREPVDDSALDHAP